MYVNNKYHAHAVVDAPAHTPHSYLPNLTLSVGMDLDS